MYMYIFIAVSIVVYMIVWYIYYSTKLSVDMGEPYTSPSFRELKERICEEIDWIVNPMPYDDYPTLKDFIVTHFVVPSFFTAVIMCIFYVVFSFVRHWSI